MTRSLALAFALTCLALVRADLAAAVDPGSELVAASLPDAATVVGRVNSRDRGQSTVQHVMIRIGDRSNTSRERRMSVYRRTTGSEHQTVLFFTSPASIDGTALLVRDYHEVGREDGLWLYLPALRTVRRISPGGRGQDFFGTDFTLLEVSTDTRLRDDLLGFTVTGRHEVDGASCLLLEAVPKNAELEREFGYSRAEYCVDETSWIPRRVVMKGISGAALKEIRFDDLRDIGGIRTVHRRSAEVLASGRRTGFEAIDVKYGVELPDSLFTESGLSHGPPRIAGAAPP